MHAHDLTVCFMLSLLCIWFTARLNTDGDKMKMKSEEETETGEEERYDVITVKAECKSEQETTEEDEDSYDEEYTINGDDLNILIKEEPQSWEIDEDNCEKIKLDAGSVCQDLEGQIKVELGCGSDDLLDHDESSGAAVKDETESWVKEETQSEEDVDNMEEDLEEGDVVSTGTRLQMKNTRTPSFHIIHSLFSHMHVYNSHIKKKNQNNFSLLLNQYLFLKYLPPRQLAVKNRFKLCIILPYCMA